MKKQQPNGISARRINHILAMMVFSLLSVIFFSTCEKSENGQNPPLPDSLTENLGSGYDVFDNYADVSKVNAAILDVDKLNADGLIELKTVEKSTFTPPAEHPLKNTAAH
jgi:hypothetical protein